MVQRTRLLETVSQKGAIYDYTSILLPVTLPNVGYFLGRIAGLRT